MKVGSSEKTECHLGNLVSLKDHCDFILCLRSQYVRGVCNFLGSVSPQQKFEASDGPELQLLVTAQFYLASKGKYIRKSCEGGLTQKMRRKAPGSILASLFILFIYFFLLPLNLPCVNWASQEGCLFYLRPSLQSSNLPLFYFHRLFPFLSFSHCHSGLLFPILTT